MQLALRCVSMENEYIGSHQHDADPERGHRNAEKDENRMTRSWLVHGKKCNANFSPILPGREDIPAAAPAVTNLLTAIADARLHSIPMGCITGQVAIPLIGTDGFQEAAVEDVHLHGADHQIFGKLEELFTEPTPDQSLRSDKIG